MLLKAFATILCVLVSTHQIRGDSYEDEYGSDELLHFSDRLRAVIRNVCMQNSDRSSYMAIVDSLDQFRHKWQVAVPHDRMRGERFYRFCIMESGQFTEYLRLFVEKLSDCLSTDELYLKEFILNSYGDYNHYFCRYLQLVRASETKKRIESKCIRKFAREPETDPLVTCYASSSVFGDNATLTVITKPELCEDILNIRGCQDELFVEHCPEATELQDLRKVLLNQALENCADVMDQGTTTEAETETETENEDESGQENYYM